MFKGKYFAFCGKLQKTHQEYKQLVQIHGGQCERINSALVTHLVTKVEDVMKLSNTVQIAMARGSINIVTEAFITDSVQQQKCLSEVSYLIKEAKKRKAEEIEKEEKEEEEEEEEDTESPEVKVNKRLRIFVGEELVLDERGNEKALIFAYTEYMMNRGASQISNIFEDVKKLELIDVHIPAEVIKQDITSDEPLKPLPLPDGVFKQIKEKYITTTNSFLQFSVLHANLHTSGIPILDDIAIHGVAKNSILEESKKMAIRWQNYIDKATTLLVNSNDSSINNNNKTNDEMKFVNLFVTSFLMTLKLYSSFGINLLTQSDQGEMWCDVIQGFAFDILFCDCADKLKGCRRERALQSSHNWTVVSTPNAYELAVIETKSVTASKAQIDGDLVKLVKEGIDISNACITHFGHNQIVPLIQAKGRDFVFYGIQRVWNDAFLLVELGSYTCPFNDFNKFIVGPLALKLLLLDTLKLKVAPNLSYSQVSVPQSGKKAGRNQSDTQIEDTQDEVMHRGTTSSLTIQTNSFGKVVIKAETETKRAEQELRAYTRMATKTNSCKHILPLLDTFVVDGVRHFVFPLCNALTIDTQIIISISDVVKYAKGGLEGLQFIHSCGLLHMDMSPSNLVVCSDTGDIKIIDFGLSQIMGNEIKPCGTDGYIAPEVEDVIHGLPNMIGPISDLFSLGIIIIEMLSYALKDPIIVSEPSDAQSWLFQQKDRDGLGDLIKILGLMTSHNLNERLLVDEILSRPPFEESKVNEIR